jgi:hypothetical protein
MKDFTVEDIRKVAQMMITICKECEHRRVNWIFDIPDQCGATKFKETNYVSGKVTYHYADCDRMNTSGICSYFESKKEKK